MLGVERHHEIVRLTDTQELIRRDVGLLQNGAQRTLG